MGGDIVNAEGQLKLDNELDMLATFMHGHGQELADVLWKITGPNQDARDVTRRWLRRNYPRR